MATGNVKYGVGDTNSPNRMAKLEAGGLVVLSEEALVEMYLRENRWGSIESSSVVRSQVLRTEN